MVSKPKRVKGNAPRGRGLRSRKDSARHEKHIDKLQRSKKHRLKLTQVLARTDIETPLFKKAKWFEKGLGIVYYGWKVLGLCVDYLLD